MFREIGTVCPGGMLCTGVEKFPIIVPASPTRPLSWTVKGKVMLFGIFRESSVPLNCRNCEVDCWLEELPLLLLLFPICDCCENAPDNTLYSWNPE